MLIDGFRPGTCERLGIGPDDCEDVNPRLVFARITGWGQHRPPVPPLNLAADFGGGSMLALLGIVAALYERHTSGRGQVIDAAMVDGVSVLAQMAWTMKVLGRLADQRETFLLDGGAPFYRSYATADGGYMAVGAIEAPFYAQLLAERFAARTRAEWTAVFAGTDACATPVLTWSEAARSEHLRGRETIVTRHGTDQAAPAPRFSRTAGPSTAADHPHRRCRLLTRN